jgi:chaperonin GroEL (HSP60 family)
MGISSNYFSMVRKMIIKNYDEFEARLEEQDVEISNAIVEVALANITSKKRFIPVLEIELEEEEEIYDISLDTEDIVSTLEQNLRIQELHENYETCFFIKEALNQLNSK